MKGFLKIINKLFLLLGIFNASSIQSNAQLVTETKQQNSFSLFNAVIYVDKNDFDLVKKSAELLQQDIEMVTGKKLAITNDLRSTSQTVIIIGTIERSSAIKDLIKSKKLNANNIKGKWEAYLLQSLPNSLIIAGSDRRGVAYGVFEISKMIKSITLRDR